MPAVTTAEVALPGDPRSAGAARQFLSKTLESWGQPDYEFGAVLLLSELVTNAILHARTDVVVRLIRLDSALRIEVGDRSLRAPMARHYSAEATTGRGLALVDSLARDWGVDLDEGGKVVWCEIADPDADAGPDDLHVDLDDFDDLDDVTGSVAQLPTPPHDARAIAA